MPTSFTKFMSVSIIELYSCTDGKDAWWANGETAKIIISLSVILQMKICHEIPHTVQVKIRVEVSLVKQK